MIDGSPHRFEALFLAGTAGLGSLLAATVQLVAAAGVVSGADRGLATEWWWARRSAFFSFAFLDLPRAVLPLLYVLRAGMSVLDFRCPLFPQPQPFFRLKTDPYPPQLPPASMVWTTCSVG
jgi:hypothetical protein